MTMEGTAINAGSQEVAIIVLQHLISHGFHKTARAFKREAQQILPGPAVPLPSVKPIASIIIEYTVLKSQEQKLQLLLSSHAALQEVYSVFERHAGLHQAAEPFVAPGTDAAMAAAGAQLQAIYPAAPPRRSRPAKQKAKKGVPGPADNQQQPVQAANSVGQAPPLLISPRKAQRKRAPKRKQVAVEHPDQAQPCEPGALPQLLNLPINERALEHLLAGEWQEQFAEGLATCINSRMGPAEQQHQQQQQLRESMARNIADAAEAAAAQSQVQVCDDADIATWMTSMTEDPSMAALLEPMVAQHSSPMLGGAAVDQGVSQFRATVGAQADSVPHLVRADGTLLPQQSGLAEDHTPQPAAAPPDGAPHAGAGMQPRHSSGEQRMERGLSGVLDSSGIGRGRDMHSAEHEQSMRRSNMHTEDMPGGGAQLAGALNSLLSSTSAAEAVDELLLTLRY